VIFLQEILTTTYGSNGPLWSLSYEFWYYILFPLVFIGYYSEGVKKYSLLLFFVIIFIALTLFSSNLITLWSIWLLGGVSVVLSKNKILCPLFSNQYMMFMFMFILSLILSRSKITQDFLAEITIGMAFSLLVVSLSKFDTSAKFYNKISNFFSNISYSLYLSHFPFIAFICSKFLDNEKFPPSQYSVSLIGVLVFLSILYGYAFYWCFEKNTAKIKAFFKVGRYLKLEKS
jgi:peptidoglycan/LPS O-acetylase OafA/YrhL